MDWKIAGGFLEKFKKIKPPKKFLQEEILKILQEKINFSFKQKDIEIKGNTILIKTDNQSLKNEIFLKREKILSELTKKIGPKGPTNIRF